MNEQQVTDLMKTSTSEDEWNANVDRVKVACKGYPGFWYSAVIQSGLINIVAAGWGGSGEIRIS